MKESTKKTLTKVYSVLLILIAASLVFVSALPIVTLKADEVKYGKEFYIGTFTTAMEMPDELEIGILPIVDFVRYFTDARLVLCVQAGTESVEAEERERLTKMLDEDEGFVNTVLLLYAFGGIAENEDDPIANDQYGESVLPIMANIISIIMAVGLVIAGIVLFVVLAIKFIILLIKSLKHINDDTDEDVDQRMNKFPFTVYTATMLMLYMICVMFAPGFGMGSAILGSVIVLVLSSVLRLAKTIAFISKNELVPLIVKQVITAVSLAAIVALLFSFVGVELFNEINEAAPKMSEVKYNLIANELLESDAREPYVTARDKVTSINGIYAGAFVFVAFTAAMTLTIGIISGVERFGNKKAKLKTGEMVPYKAMIVLAVFALIVAIIPTYLAVDSKDALKESYEKGEIKIWYTEYQEEGTMLNLEYELAKAFKEEGDEELAELREELKSAEGEKAEKIEEQIEEAEAILAEAEETVKNIEARAKRPTTCLIAAIVFFISEIAYLVASKVFAKNKKEEEPAVEPAAE